MGSYQATNLGLIPVPSRLYFDSPSDSLPLSGKRIAVKDVFDLKGTTTSAGVRAFADFYGVLKTSAPAIQQLITKGAVIVGKTKTVQFASGESPMDWIDYHCPFNPRGDGYFTASGSSTGSAAGLAAYDWLDITIGTDSELYDIGRLFGTFCSHEDSIWKHDCSCVMAGFVRDKTYTRAS